MMLVKHAKNQNSDGLVANKQIKISVCEENYVLFKIYEYFTNMYLH